jgi:N-acetylglucosamine kinase-like BadF-type ATPase
MDLIIAVDAGGTKTDCRIGTAHVLAWRKTDYDNKRR